MENVRSTHEPIGLSRDEIVDTERLITTQPTKPKQSPFDVNELIASAAWGAGEYHVVTEPTNKLSQDALDVPGRISESENQLFKTYITTRGLVKFHIRAYNHWITETSHRMIGSLKLRLRDGNLIMFTGLHNTDTPLYTLNGKDVHPAPKFYLDRGYSYTQFWTMVPTMFTPDGKRILTKSLERVKVGDIPVMVRSMNCNTYGWTAHQLALAGESSVSEGSYWIVGGKERVILLQEKLVTDKFLITPSKAVYAGRVTTDTPKGTRVNQLTLSKGKIVTINLSTTTILKEQKKLPNEGRRKPRVKEQTPSVVRTEEESTTPGECAPPKKKKDSAYAYYNVLAVYRLFGIENYNEIVSMILFFLPDEDKNICEAELAATSNMYLTSSREKDIECIANILQLKDKTTAEQVIINALEHDLFPGLNELPPMEGEKMSEEKGDEQNDIAERTYKLRKRTLKLCSLSIMIARFLQWMVGRRKEDNRDGWENKRVELPVRELNALIRGAWNFKLGDIQKKIDEAPKELSFDAVVNLLKDCHRDVTKTVYDSFVRTTWGATGSQKRENMVQLLQQEGILASIMHLLLINVNMSRKGGQKQARIIQPSQFGFVDPVYTPDGKTCGIVKSLAVTTSITLERDDTDLILILYKYLDQQGDIFLTVNAKYLGKCKRETKAKLIQLRRLGEIDKEVSIILEEGFLYVLSAPGRLVRPLLIVENNKLLIDQYPGDNVDTLIEKGAIEYVSAWEQQHLYIAVTRFDLQAKDDRIVQAEEQIKKALQDKTSVLEEIAEKAKIAERELASIRERARGKPGVPTRATIERYERPVLEAKKKLEEAKRKVEEAEKLIVEENAHSYTHCELSPEAFLGVGSSAIPFIGHNMAPRNQFQVNMSKSAVAIYHGGHRAHQYKGKVPAFPSVPPVATYMYELTGERSAGTGNNVFLAIAAVEYTEEDAFVIKKEAIQRGLFRTVTYILKKKRVQSAHNEFIGIPPTYEHNKEKYRHLVMFGENIGLPIVGSYLSKGDCVIGAYKEIGTGPEKTKVDLPSEYIKIGEEGIVSNVWITYSRDAKTKVITVKLYRYKVAIEGDKFSPRNAQKGTAGRIADEIDMPFLSEYGITPDIIINPHQIISRMTLSYLLEILSATYTAITGERVDASPFRSGEAARVLGEELRKRGFNQFGYASFVHGKTGQVIPVMVFSGLVFFQTFKHMVENKYQSYGNKGHRQPGTYSVTKGRKHEGSIRTGHMEIGALGQHGATAKTRDILCNSADKVTIPLCMRCGFPSTWNRAGQTYMCTACGDKNSIGMADMPYSIRYFQLILMVAGISLTPVVDTVVNYNKKNSITCEDIAYTGEMEGTADEDPENEASRSDSEVEEELVLHPEEQEEEEYIPEEELEEEFTYE